eukprot:1947182-Pyramimonas_sp.AAC.1
MLEHPARREQADQVMALTIRTCSQMCGPTTFGNQPSTDHIYGTASKHQAISSPTSSSSRPTSPAPSSATACSLSCRCVRQASTLHAHAAPSIAPSRCVVPNPRMHHSTTTASSSSRFTSRSPTS